MRCCKCERSDVPVRTIVQFQFEAPEGFQGWGCVQCGAPSRGAVAVVCDGCADTMKSGEEVRFICGGKYMGDDVLVPLQGYERRPFGCDLSKHPEVTRQ